MAKQAVVPTVSQNNSFDQWRVTTNDVITKSNNQEDYIGDLAELEESETNLVDAVNNARSYSIAVSIALG
jgi:hypothetical protein